MYSNHSIKHDNTDNFSETIQELMTACETMKPDTEQGSAAGTMLTLPAMRHRIIAQKSNYQDRIGQKEKALHMTEALLAEECKIRDQSQRMIDRINEQLSQYASQARSLNATTYQQILSVIQNIQRVGDAHKLDLNELPIMASLWSLRLDEIIAAYLSVGMEYLSLSENDKSKFTERLNEMTTAYAIEKIEYHLMMAISGNTDADRAQFSYLIEGESELLQAWHEQIKTLDVKISMAQNGNSDSLLDASTNTVQSEVPEPTEEDLINERNRIQAEIEKATMRSKNRKLMYLTKLISLIETLTPEMIANNIARYIKGTSLIEPLQKILAETPFANSSQLISKIWQLISEIVTQGVKDMNYLAIGDVLHRLLHDGSQGEEASTEAKKKAEFEVSRIVFDACAQVAAKEVGHLIAQVIDHSSHDQNIQLISFFFKIEKLLSSSLDAMDSNMVFTAFTSQKTAEKTREDISSTLVDDRAILDKLTQLSTLFEKGEPAVDNIDEIIELLKSISDISTNKIISDRSPAQLIGYQDGDLSGPQQIVEHQELSDTYHAQSSAASQLSERVQATCLMATVSPSIFAAINAIAERFNPGLESTTDHALEEETKNSHNEKTISSVISGAEEGASTNENQPVDGLSVFSATRRRSGSIIESNEDCRDVSDDQPSNGMGSIT